MAPSRAVRHPHRLGLDGDAPLALQIHAIEHLLAHLALADRIGDLQECDRPAWISTWSMWAMMEKIANVRELSHEVIVPQRSSHRARPRLPAEMGTS